MSLSAQKYHNNILTLLNTNFDSDVSVAHDVAKCALPGKVMQGSPRPVVHTFINENGRYIMKLNDCFIINGLQNNMGLFLKSQNWVLTCISIYAMDFYREITQDIVMFHSFYSIINSIKE